MLMTLAYRIFITCALCWIEVFVVGLWLEAWGLYSDQSLCELFVLLLGVHMACFLGRGLIRVIEVVRDYFISLEQDAETAGKEVEK